MDIKTIGGGITAPKGFKASGIRCGVRKNKEKRDLALIFSETDCAAAAVYTTNRVKASPVYVTMENLESGRARAMICNSGNANACAPNGYEYARRTCAALAKCAGIAENEIIIASTGVIGVELNVAAVENGMRELVDSLSGDGTDDAAEAIMTTDTRKKIIAVEFEIGGRPVRVAGVAKGSGMINPNMATMLAFITTDAAIDPELLHEALSESVKKTFNRVSVDGDTSTNDMCAVMASGLAGNGPIDRKDDAYRAFAEALTHVNTYLAKSVARDGEGATRLVSCRVFRSRSEESAEKLAKAVISSSLVKSMMFGADANWGRILCAMGYSKAPFRPEYVDVSFVSAAGTMPVCKNGAGLEFDEAAAKAVLSEDEVTIDVNVNEGEYEATAWGCDLTYEYVKINGDYRT